MGALAFNTLRTERSWPDSLVSRLQLFAQVLTNALARRRHELRLLESEQRLALAADSAEAGLWTLDYGTGVFWATDKARAIFGYAPDDVIDTENLRARVHPDDWDLVRGAIESSARVGAFVNVEYRIVLPGDGGVRWISSRGQRHRPSAGEPERLMGVCVDVTEQKLAEERSRADQARLEAATELAGLVFYEVDLGAHAVFVDERFRDACGIPPEAEPELEF